MRVGRRHTGAVTASYRQPNSLAWRFGRVGIEWRANRGEGTHARRHRRLGLMRSTTAPRTRPFTGAEYLESVRDGREIWIYGERVKDVTTHPAFRNTVRMIARLYDALHDPATKADPHDRDRHRQRRLHAQVLQGAPATPRSWSAPATRSPSGRASPTAGSAAAPTTRRRSSPRSAPMPATTRPTTRTPDAGTRRSRKRSPSSTTPSSIRRSIATSRSTR